MFVLHSQRHKIADHIREDSRTGHLEPLTATGAFNIRLLHLNRPQLVAQRMERQALDVERQRLKLLQSEIEQSDETIRVLEQYQFSAQIWCSRELTGRRLILSLRSLSSIKPTIRVSLLA